MQCVLGIDSGGTKCDALVVTEDGQTLGWGRCDFRNEASGRGTGGSGRSFKSIQHAVRRAMHGVRCDVLHIAIHGYAVPVGCWSEGSVHQIFLDYILEHTAAFALAGETCGIVALSGTGAFVHGRTRDGRHVTLDGLGPMVGDYGSGYHIGSLAIRAAARAKWHPRHATVLGRSVHAALGGKESDPPNRNVFYEFVSGDRDRAEIAALARLVQEAADAGDAVARRILEEAAEALAETLHDVIGRLDMANDEYPLIGTGGIIANVDRFWEHFCAKAAELAPRLRPVRLRTADVAGVVLAKLLSLKSGDPDALREKVVQTTRELFAKNTTTQEKKPSL